MELSLTKEQQEYLDKRGPITAATLKRIYKKSVEDQQKTLREAEKIRTRQDKRN